MDCACNHVPRILDAAEMSGSFLRLCLFSFFDQGVGGKEVREPYRPHRTSSTGSIKQAFP